MCNLERISERKYLCAVSCLLHLWVIGGVLIGEEGNGASEVSQPNAADLVRAVRESENWIHKVDSFYLRMESKWTTPTHPNLPGESKRSRVGRPYKSGTTEAMEFAFDNKRAREMRDMHGGTYALRIWNGSQLIEHMKLDPLDRGYYNTDSKLEGNFLRLIASSGSWPRAQPHSFWFDKKNVAEILPHFGMPEDFVLTGRSQYRGVDCYVLECDLSSISETSVGRMNRWYVGTKDRLLYGQVHVRHGKAGFEYWSYDYKKVAGNWKMPMQQGYEIYGIDAEGEPYLYTRRDLKIVEVRVNEQLSDELFQVQLEEGVEVVDKRTGETITYIRKEPLVGKALPDSNGIDINFTAEEMLGKSLLICFWDMNQRPSRHMVRELVKRAEYFKEKDVVVVFIQASKVEKGKLDEWVKENRISFAVGMIEGDEEKVRFNWGVKSLPWLILTDRSHIVRAEGFGIDELNEKIGANENNSSSEGTRTEPMRVVHFPKDRSLGVLHVRDRDLSIDMFDAWQDWEQLGQARADVKVPAGKALRLSVTPEAWKSGEPFAGLKTDDIQMITFEKYRQADDSVIKDISTLTKLEALSLSGTQIIGTEFRHLRALKKLKWLGLTRVDVGDREIAVLEGLGSLQYLHLRQTGISDAGLAHVGKMKTLKGLMVSWTSIGDEGLAHLAGLTELERLYLFDTGVGNAGMIHLSEMRELKTLRLGRTKVGDAGLAYLKDLESLEYLELPYDTNISDQGLVHLSELKSLRQLYINSDSITDKGLETLQRIESLEDLDIGGPNITDAGAAKLAALSSLKKLSLQKSPITDAGLKELKNLKSLTSLYLNGIPVTGKGLATLKELPLLTDLTLSYLNLGESGLSGLAELTSLESLNLHFMEVSDEDLADISALSSLKKLSVIPRRKRSAITDAGMEHVSKLKLLEYLGLQDTDVTDAGLKHLQGLTALKRLSLRNSKVTEEGLTWLKKRIPAVTIVR